MDNERIKMFRDIYAPWPEKCPNAKEDVRGWFAGRPKQLEKVVPENPKVILELGSWLGKSTLWFLNRFPKAEVICVDHWKGDPTNWSLPGTDKILPTLYKTFLRNTWDYRDRLTPVKMPTLEGVRLIARAKIVPDLIYIDAGHDEESVYKDITACLTYFPNATVTGDDWNDFGVTEGVNRALREFGDDNLSDYALWTGGKIWALLKRGN